MQGWIGVDFGTTNSVVTAIGPDGTASTSRFGAPGLDTFRSVLCFWTAIRQRGTRLLHAAGPEAIEAYLADPLDARLMLSLKTYLAQASFTQTQVFGTALSLEALVGLFLRALLGAAGVPPGASIVAGRPVRFAGEAADDALGEARLRATYQHAGAGRMHLAPEPEAAGYRFTRGLDAPATVLIGDFGGGTSDFSLLRFEPDQARPTTALASSGVGVAGDSLDFRIIDRVVSPLLGKGGSYSPGNTPLPVPPEFYSSFARWHRLSQMRSPRTLRDIAAVAGMAADPQPLRHLIRLIEDEAAYPLYQAVAAVKAELSRADHATLRFVHEDFEVSAPIARHEFEAWIAPDLAHMAAGIDHALAQAAIPASAVDRVFLTGGTSFVPAVRALFTKRFGAGRVSAGGEFVSVSEGLALIGQDLPA